MDFIFFVAILIFTAFGAYEAGREDCNKDKYIETLEQRLNEYESDIQKVEKENC